MKICGYDCNFYSFFKVKYLDAWTQEPSSKLTATIRTELKSHKESFENATGLDPNILADLKEFQHVVTLLNQSLDRVEKQFIKEVITAVPAKNENTSLLDENADKSKAMGVLGEQIIVEKVDALLQHVRSLKKERVEILEEISAKVS